MARISTPIKTADQILEVERYCRETNGDAVVKCPHCKSLLALEPGPIKGEQFQHPVCDGWLEVSHDAVRVIDAKAL